MKCGRPEIAEAIKLFQFLNGKIIVEIGSIRQTHDWMGDGHSTFAWAQVAEKIYTVDIDPAATALTADLTKEFKNVHAVNQDGIAFLEGFSEPIDLLYLDGWDADQPDCGVCHLKAYEAAKKNLHMKSIILIDDTGVVEKEGVRSICDQKGSKGELVIPQALKDGWVIGLQLYQTLLAKSDVLFHFLQDYHD